MGKPSASEYVEIHLGEKKEPLHITREWASFKAWVEFVMESASKQVPLPLEAALKKLDTLSSEVALRSLAGGIWQVEIALSSRTCLLGASGGDFEAVHADMAEACNRLLKICHKRATFHRTETGRLEHPTK